ncbi:hypothetical protein [Clostridium sp.]|uniref:hypothetical protein n=1 Tax=Clostridium sp. TaxID=1506 RepID=UPI002FCC88FD
MVTLRKKLSPFGSSLPPQVSELFGQWFYESCSKTNFYGSLVSCQGVPHPVRFKSRENIQLKGIFYGDKNAHLNNCKIKSAQM